MGVTCGRLYLNEPIIWLFVQFVIFYCVYDVLSWPLSKETTKIHLKSCPQRRILHKFDRLWCDFSPQTKPKHQQEQKIYLSCFCFVRTLLLINYNFFHTPHNPTKSGTLDPFPMESGVKQVCLTHPDSFYLFYFYTQFYFILECYRSETSQLDNTTLDQLWKKFTKRNHVFCPFLQSKYHIQR